MHTEILLPENAPAEYADRAVLWNAVEKIEKAKNSQLAREIEIALPVELTREQNRNLVREYVNQYFVQVGMCADICLHDTGGGNPHAHIMLTMRPFTEEKTWGAKQKKEYILDPQGNKIHNPQKRQYKCKSIPTTDWNEQTKAEEWRGAWAEICNKYLEQSNRSERIDHRSYERQGVDKIPAVHLGVAVYAMEKRGIRTELGNINRYIEVTNIELLQLKGRIKKLKKRLYEQPITDAPTMIDVMKFVSTATNLESRWKKVINLKERANLLVFLQENGIDDMSRLVGKVEELHQSQYDLGKKIKTEERRISTLSQHLSQIAIYKSKKAVYKQYKSLGPNKRDAYYEKHFDEISAYESASKYLKDQLNGYDKIPEKEWREERSKMLTQRYAHAREYYALKEAVKEVERIRHCAELIIRDNPLQNISTKKDYEI